MPEVFHTHEVVPVIVGMLTAAVSGWFAIAVLMRYVQHRGLGVFALYRLALGLAVIALAWSRSR